MTSTRGESPVRVLETVLETVLESPPEGPRLERLADWRLHYGQLVAHAPDTFARAVLGGVRADRLGWAFATAYRSALERLVPGLSPGAMASLAVTETGGNVPKALTTRLHRRGEGHTLEGDKSWVTLCGDDDAQSGSAGASDVVLVVARVEDSDAARPSLKLVRVAAGAPGVTITARPAAPFVPEIPHARLALRDVSIDADAVYEGDAWERYVKPFRTLEDTHVLGAVLGHVVREIRRRGASEAPQGQRTIEGALAALGALGAVDALAPERPHTHVALGGALTLAHEVLERFDAMLQGASDEAAQRWARDRVLVSVAAGARAARLEKAWQALTR